MLERIVGYIGYEMQGAGKVHYSILIMTISRNGLRQIISKEDKHAMSKFMEIRHHFINMYPDHDESTRAMNWDVPDFQSRRFVGN